MGKINMVIWCHFTSIKKVVWHDLPGGRVDVVMFRNLGMSCDYVETTAKKLSLRAKN